MKIFRFLEVIGWGLIVAVYVLSSYLLSDYTKSDYSYWIRVVWSGLILTLMYTSVTVFNRKARLQNNNTPLYIAFVIKMCLCGLISIGICIRSYFFDSNWMQVINILSQSIITIYLILVSTGLISVGILESTDRKTLISRKVFLDDCNTLFIDIENHITVNNVSLFKKVKELFHKSILVVNSDNQLKNLNNIKSSLMRITPNSDEAQQNEVLLNTINIINDFYR
ncbi:MAG: hypothetical protein K2X04_11445 [Burkholderiales bacterium]|nr:hypothetical protein [Burkholderiales bacterium]